jgi:hypothetical protein
MKLVQKSFEPFFISHIDRGQMYTGTQSFQLTNGGDLLGQATAAFDFAPGGARRELSASQKNQPSSPLLDHPAGNQEA